MEALVFETCLISGLALIVVAFVLVIVRSARRQQSRNYIPKNKRAGDRSVAPLCDFDIPWELNYEAFNIADYSNFSNLNSSASKFQNDILNATMGALSDSPRYAYNIVEEDEEDENTAQNLAVSAVDDCAKVETEKTPTLVLASLLEIQSMQEAQEIEEFVPLRQTRPRMLGETACEMGIRYFDNILSKNTLPRDAAMLTNNSNIIIAKNALKTLHPSAILSHGGIAQRIGSNAVCLFDPLETPIVHLDKALEQMDALFDGKSIFLILANTDLCSVEALAHIGPICRRYSIAKTDIYIEQSDGSFYNYIENANDYVPSRLDPLQISQAFFTEIFDYAQTAYDSGDFDAVLRTLEPLVHPILQRIHSKGNFPPVLAAQALNLIGMTFREIGNDDRAINAFDASLSILQRIEDYNAIKAVKANLGITLALSQPTSLPKIELAVRHLNEVTQLNPRDAEAWLFLANSYIEQFKFTNAHSLLGRALRAYKRSYEIDPADDVAQCMAELEQQIGTPRQRAYCSGNSARNAGNENLRNAH